VSIEASSTLPSDESGFLETDDAAVNEAMVVTSATSLWKNITAFDQAREREIVELEEVEVR
jgi:hypothetical protein